MKILFISHDATRTGAPMLLLNLVKWLSENKDLDYRITILLRKGGPLITEFEKYGTVIFFNKTCPVRLYLLRSYLINRYQKKIISELKASSWDLIFSNTIVNGQLLELLANSQAPIVSYIHELEFSIKEIFTTRSCSGYFFT